MILRVYHSRQNRFDEVLGKKDNYKAVADVVVPDQIPVIEALDYAFKDTNHIHRAWWENPNVKKLVSENVRSISVGDLIESTTTGELYLCMNVGWVSVNFLDNKE